MKRVFAVLELAETSTFDPEDEGHLDHLAEDLLSVAHKVTGAAVYPSLEALVADEG